MFELTIMGETYQFKFGMKFVRDINKRVTRKVEGLDTVEELGLSMAIAKVIDKDLDTLYDVLRLANEGYKPRLELKTFDEWIEDEKTDIDAVFNEVIDFFGKSNCTKIAYNKVKAEVDKLEQA